MYKSFYLLAENERGLLTELQFLKNFPLEHAKREADRLAAELGKPVHVVTSLHFAHVHEWELKAPGQMYCIHCGMFGPMGE